MTEEQQNLAGFWTSNSLSQSQRRRVKWLAGMKTSAYLPKVEQWTLFDVTEHKGQKTKVIKL